MQKELYQVGKLSYAHIYKYKAGPFELVYHFFGVVINTILIPLFRFYRRNESHVRRLSRR